MSNNRYSISNSEGLIIDFLDTGSVQQIVADPIRISLKSATPFTRSGANIYARKIGAEIQYKALTGPDSNSQFTLSGNIFISRGSWDGIEYTCFLQLSEKSRSWQWTIYLRNTTGQALELDLLHVQDIGLKPVSERSPNEYYVSQYLERLILEDQRYGAVICCRQNMKEAGGHPWIMLACGNGAASAAVDGMQVFGKKYRVSGIPECLLQESLGGEYSGESSWLALQEKPFMLAGGESHRSNFAGTFFPDHPGATSANDLTRLDGLMNEFEKISFPTDNYEWQWPEKNVFNTASFLPSEDLDEEDLENFFGRERRHAELSEGKLMSFFYDKNTYVCLQEKEILADRPHAHIMQAGQGYRPDERIVSSTSFAFGVFLSQLSQGNTNFNRLLSVCTSQFNLSPESGQRMILGIDGCDYLLGVPSAFEIGLNHCRWIYKHAGRFYQVRSWTSKSEPRVNMDFRVIGGEKVKLLITHQFDESNGWQVYPTADASIYTLKPAASSMLSGKFPQGHFSLILNGDNVLPVHGDEALYFMKKSAGDSFVVFDVPETSGFCMSLVAEVCGSAGLEKISDAEARWVSDCRDAQTAWQDLSLNLRMNTAQPDIAAIMEILPWYGMNALTHYQTPYGLEQFSGAAWGTRDVSQGPVDLLLNMEKYDEAKQVICTLFSHQDPDGGWPQWWMFDSYSNIRADSAHGDIFYWCILALCQYIRVTGDTTILEEVLPYYHDKGYSYAEKTSLAEHMDRLLQMIIQSFIPGTALVPFGGGDWNDSLQPVSKELAGRMISSWTVEMNYQAFRQYQEVQEFRGNSAKADELKTICENIKTDFHRYLVKDGIVAGYGLLEEDGSISVLLHPDDTKTGISYSILPMNRGIISGIFSKEQAQYHQPIIEKHLKGPDGARLMDKPLRYKGGIQEIFQRAESSTFFGREIGLMYVHEHIRYAESQAILGKAEEFVKALRQANPVAYQEIVPCGDTRQSNCYYSSSDVIFKSRYEADERYDEIKTGKRRLRGGWRVYSSGPGIYIGLVISRLLGLRKEFGNIILDPVLPKTMDGLSASLNFMGHSTTFTYRITENSFSPKTIHINGKAITFTREENHYRMGGAIIPAEHFLALMDREENMVEITL